MGEGDRADPATMPLKGLQASTPATFHDWIFHNPLRLLFLKQSSYEAAGWAEYKCRMVYL